VKTEIVSARECAKAIRLLRDGEVVALPTETVYGLAADALNPEAVTKIFEAKERPRFDPLIVHLPIREALDEIAIVESQVAHKLMEKFWPGPLTIIFPKREIVPDIVTAGLETVAVRMSAHPVFCEIIRKLNRPLAAPSANRFGRISPTLASHVIDEFGDSLAVLDGGACEIGIESSIVDCSRGHPVLLRPGVLTHARIEAAAGEPLRAPDADAPRASGTLAAHYAPNAKLRLMSQQMLTSALQLLGDQPLKLAVYSRSVPLGAAKGVRHRRMPLLPDQAAHELFSVLRELDAEGAQLIWVEEPPVDPEWDGVRDRLLRAAAS
jgi:L-threonylcarbamoyladenylate synthase